MRLRTVMVLVGLAAFAAAALGLGARASYGARTIADEPQYLLTALSLAEDGDLDIGDELVRHRYAPFHERRLPDQTRDLGGGRHLSPHDPLLPAVLAPAMAIGGWAAAKATMAALAGLLAGLMTWTAVRRFGVPVGTAGMVVGAFAVSAPLTAYGTQIYPELPAALAVTVAIATLTGPLASARALAVLSISLVALPWLAVKYTPVAAVLAGVALVRLARRRRWRAALATAAVLGVAAVAYALFHQRVYGGWTAYAAGSHFVTGEAGVIGSSPDHLGRSRRLVGLLADRDFGLVVWAPAFLAVPAAVGALVARRPRGTWTLLLPAAAGWLTATFVALTMHGWWWPGRQVVVVVPCLVLAVAWASSQIRWVRLLALGGGAVGAVTWAWLALGVHTGVHTLIVDFTATSNPWVRAVRPVLPDGRDDGPGAGVLTLVWAVLLGLLAVAGAVAARRVGDRDTAAPSLHLRRPAGPTISDSSHQPLAEVTS